MDEENKLKEELFIRDQHQNELKDKYISEYLREINSNPVTKDDDKIKVNQDNPMNDICELDSKITQSESKITNILNDNLD